MIGSIYFSAEQYLRPALFAATSSIVFLALCEWRSIDRQFAPHGELSMHWAAGVGHGL